MFKKENEEPEVVAGQDVETAQQTTEVEETDTQVNDKVAELEQQCADLADRNLRMMAEFDNYRRRTNKEKLELLKTAGEDIFKDMLPLVDDFERAKAAMQQADDVQALREGIELIYNKFLTFLAKHEVTPIDTDNAEFNTEFHEAITTLPAPTEEQKGKVLDCTQKGYMLSEKVIRYAKVVVGE
ncbi:MAG: nucleotide exchange factor GrpE [Paludibacter sp.]|nr:nucleotide exchange factor GrpE [Bacteroidales bacterium]MCM1069183.1 nucleotide exchange factor GrpE [Prevotella sp.]MCM1354088.1 nucleotide exchange factor GrpE [Bacteroides sp.]MCM1442939.1 nucleotide exchange factor GrpE [Muribaculum sp.]MCM1481738.1 nucleotide exchange factor GrpE [Paludibacter sp.]